jgi:hypothetical protein
MLEQLLCIISEAGSDTSPLGEVEFTMVNSGEGENH